MAKVEGSRSRVRVKVKGSGVRVGRTLAAGKWIVDDRLDRTPPTPLPRLPDRVAGPGWTVCIACNHGYKLRIDVLQMEC
jgi:hypothetical protein